MMLMWLEEIMKHEDPERYKVEQLKNNWYAKMRNGLHWDIEDTEGFENYYIELKAFHIGCELDWKQDQDTLVKNKAKALNCSLELASYILGLEDTIEEIRLFMAKF